MRVLQIFGILSMALFLSSCGGSAGKTKLKISLAAVTGSVNFPGGLLVIARDSSRTKEISKVVPASDVIELEMDNGIWDFAFIGWDGNGHFQGTNYCASILQQELKGQELPLNPQLTLAKCKANPELGAMDAAGLFPIVNFHSCGGADSYVSTGDIPQGTICGSTGPTIAGGMKSFKVRIGLKNEQGSLSLGLGGSCVNEVPGTSHTLGTSSLRLPQGSPGLPLHYVVEAFALNNCASAPSQVFVFNQGLAGKHDQLLKGYAISNLSNHSTDIYLSAPLCGVAQQSMQPFANAPSFGISPSVGVSRLICNADQWNNIENDVQTVSNEEVYVIAGQVDFALVGGNNITIGAGAQPFSGELRGTKSLVGSNITLMNGNAPLFGTIEVAASGYDVRISSLDISSMNISISSGSDSFGILAKKVMGNNNGGRVEIDDLSFDSSNSIVTTSPTSGANVGGIIGAVDFTTVGNNNEFSLRKVNSQIQVNTVADTSTLSNTGGVIGYMHGHDTTSDYYLAMEAVRVGVANPFNVADTSLRTSVSGKHHVGGLVGSGRNVDIRNGVMVIAALSGEQSIGGAVGFISAGNYNRLHAMYSDTHFNSTSDADFIGGMVGEVADASSLWIEESFVTFKAHSSDGLNNMGGALGGVNYTTGGSSIEVLKTKVDVDINSEGDNVGGVIGLYTNSSTPQGSAVISGSLVTGDISVPANVLTNMARGGFAGLLRQGDVEFSLVKLDTLEGNESVGGGAGKLDSGRIQESSIKVAALSCLDNTANINCGGAVGQLSATYTDNTLRELYLENNISLPNLDFVSGGCNVNNFHCGAIVGNDNTAASNDIEHFFIVNSTVLDDDGQASTDLCGSGGGNCTSIAPTVVETTAATCGALPAQFTATSGTCFLTFEQGWNDYGLTGNYLRAGNRVEPFLIDTPAKWNGIGTDVFLLKRSFLLTNDIDFGHGAFVPLGGDNIANTDEAFQGHILANNNVLRNITLTTTDIGGVGQTSAGLVPMLRGSLGVRHEPLVIENLNLICSSSRCGVVGELDGGRVSVRVKNGTIDGGAGATQDNGGLVGYSSQSYGEIASSGFEGSIHAPYATNVGGLVGSYLGSTGAIRIDDSYAHLGFIIGDNIVGGLLGAAPNTSGDVSIKRSYVWLENGNSAGLDIQANVVSGKKTGGFVGSIDPGNTVDIDDSYIDYSLANLEVGFASIGDNGLDISNVSVIGPGPITGDNPSGAIISVPSHSELFNNQLDNDYDWAQDSIGRVRIGGEINGYGDN